MKNSNFNIVAFILLMMLSLQLHAQIVVNPNGGKMNPAVKKAAEQKAANDKILNATVSEITFSVWGEKNVHSLYSYFKSKEFILNGNNKNPFHLLLVNPEVNKVNDVLEFKTPISGKDKYAYAQYKTFLENGFTVEFSFAGRYSRIEGKEFAANYAVKFGFTDGTTVVVPLQGVTIAGTKGIWTSTENVYVKKSFDGSAFPDPANPLVLQQVK